MTSSRPVGATLVAMSSVLPVSSNWNPGIASADDTFYAKIEHATSSEKSFCESYVERNIEMRRLLLLRWGKRGLERKNIMESLVKLRREKKNESYLYAVIMKRLCERRRCHSKK